MEEQQTRCGAFNSARDEERQNMKYATDSRSLYANKIYDNQMANQRAYTHYPVGIREGFGFSNKYINYALIVLVVLLVLYVCYIMFYQHEEVTLDSFDFGHIGERVGSLWSDVKSEMPGMPHFSWTDLKAKIAGIDGAQELPTVSQVIEPVELPNIPAPPSGTAMPAPPSGMGMPAPQTGGRWFW